MATTWKVPEGYDGLPVIGIKHDHAKPRMSLMPEGVLDEMLAVLEHGSAKYSDDNWQAVPNAYTRYYDAAHRHINAWWNCEDRDPESGKHHLAHAMCCLAFLMWFDKQEENS